MATRGCKISKRLQGLISPSVWGNHRSADLRHAELRLCASGPQFRGSTQLSQPCLLKKSNSTYISCIKMVFAPKDSLSTANVRAIPSTIQTSPLTIQKEHLLTQQRLNHVSSYHVPSICPYKPSNRLARPERSLLDLHTQRSSPPNPST